MVALGPLGLEISAPETGIRAMPCDGGRQAWRSRALGLSFNASLRRGSDAGSRNAPLDLARDQKGNANMEHRYLKMLLAVAVGLQALFWFGNNLLNWETATGAVGYALSQADQAGGYERHLVPPIHSPVLAALVTMTVVIGEGAAGVLALWGAVRLWRARHVDEDAFVAAKRFAVLGAGIAVLVWFLLFAVFGGALLQMGQAPGLRPALDGAFKFATYSFLVLIYLSIPEPRTVGSVRAS